MLDENSGLAIALQRIAQEASERTGFLDLGQLGLTELPEALFRLTHLRQLNLGTEFWCQRRLRLVRRAGMLLGGLWPCNGT